MMLDDTRGGLDASSLHRDTSMDISLYKEFRLLSCHRDQFGHIIFYLSLNTSLLSFSIIFLSFHGILKIS